MFLIRTWQFFKCVNAYWGYFKSINTQIWLIPIYKILFQIFFKLCCFPSVLFQTTMVFTDSSPFVGTLYVGIPKKSAPLLMRTSLFHISIVFGPENDFLDDSIDLGKTINLNGLRKTDFKDPYTCTISWLEHSRYQILLIYAHPSTLTLPLNWLTSRRT